MSTCCLPNQSIKRAGSGEIKYKPMQSGFFDFFFLKCLSTSWGFLFLGIKQPHALPQICSTLDHLFRNCKTAGDEARQQRDFQQRHSSWILRYVGPKKFWSAIGPEAHELFSWSYCKLSLCRMQMVGECRKTQWGSHLQLVHWIFSWAAGEVNFYIVHLRLLQTFKALLRETGHNLEVFGKFWNWLWWA